MVILKKMMKVVMTENSTALDSHHALNLGLKRHLSNE